MGIELKHGDFYEEGFNQRLSKEHVVEALRQMEAELRELRADKARLDWLDSINPVGCFDGWIDAGEMSHAVTVWTDGEGRSVRSAIDSARKELE